MITKCPKCGAEPFFPFLRLQIVPNWSWLVSLFLPWRKHKHALICSDCFEIIGWE